MAGLRHGKARRRESVDGCEPVQVGVIRTLDLLLSLHDADAETTARGQCRVTLLWG